MSGMTRFTGIGAEMRHVLPRHDRDHPLSPAGCIDVQPSDASVRVGGAHEDHVQAARGGEVVHVAAGAGEQARVFASLHGPADIAGAWVFARVGHGHELTIFQRCPGG